MGSLPYRSPGVALWIEDGPLREALDARIGGEQVSEARRRRAAARQAAAKVLREELERAERRGEEGIRQRVLAIPASKRYMHTVGQVTFEVIDAAAAEEAIRVTKP